MTERKKVREYREALHELARDPSSKDLEGKAAKLGVEIYGEERKGKPRATPKGKPRRRGSVE